VGELQQPLHGPDLAERAVQDRQDDVHDADHLERPGLGRNRQRLRRTSLGAWHQDMAGAVRSGLESPAAVAADRDFGDLVPLRVERPGDRPRRRKRDLVLARAAAREDGHAETAGRPHPSPVVGGGGGGPGECWPTRMVTVEPFSAWEVPIGFCDWTMFCWLASVATVCWVTRKPACSRVDTACWEV